MVQRGYNWKELRKEMSEITKLICWTCLGITLIIMYFWFSTLALLNIDNNTKEPMITLSENSNSCELEVLKARNDLYVEYSTKGYLDCEDLVFTDN